MINQASRRGNDNFDTGSQGPYLLTLGHTSIYHSVLDFGTCSKLIALFLDLNSELSCGGKDKYDGPLARLEILLYVSKNKINMRELCIHVQR
jgi:hypothetical protein